MKKAIPFLLAVITCCIFAFRPALILPIGAELPKASAQLKDVSGKDVSMKGAAKKNGLLVMFSCNSCPFVIKNQERTIAVGQYAQKMNVGFIILNSNEGQRGSDDSFEEMKSYAESQKYNFNYVVDQNNEVADAFGANRTPECFLFDKELKLAYHGAIDDSPSDPGGIKRQHLKEAIDELVAGKSVSVPESKSIGCSIKRKKA